MDFLDVLAVFIKIAVVLIVLLTLCAYATLLERKLVARFQSRIGPNRAGPKGILQPLADFVKLLFKGFGRKIYAAGSFRFFETYNIVALIYLTMTISISLALRKFERGLEKKTTLDK